MDKISYNQHGQWTLIKSAKPRFDPKSEWGSEAGKARSTWTADDTEPDAASAAKYSIPKMTGTARVRALSKLTGSTEHRRNPNTGKVEFLLHRGMSNDEASQNIANNSASYPHKTRTSWTPNASVAHRQAYYEEPRGKVVSAWIPEEHLHSSMRQYGSEDPNVRKLTSHEDEWIVEHPKSSIEVHGISDAVKPKKI